MLKSNLAKHAVFSLYFILSISYNIYAGDPPFGSFDTPTNGATVSGSVPLTGWALDDQGVQSLKIYRAPISGEGSNDIFIGEADFIQDSRPDVEAAYPGYPNNDSAGWGYMLLTYFLPNQGNGTFTLYATATDVEDNTVTLGSKTIIADNANAVKPFGALDTPSNGSTISGSSYLVQGWALTPQPNTIPTDGSTITVYVDGSPVGHPTYNHYRGDIATIFPGYNNSNGAGFYLYLDTKAYINGTHTFAITATDDAGNTDGIASIYVTIDNEEPLPVFLSSFTAETGPDGITLNWTTESEIDHCGFIIERSVDDQATWQQIANFKDNDDLKCQGYCSTPTHYTFTDKTSPHNGTCFYRLSDVDMNGIRTIHSPLCVDCGPQLPETIHLKAPFPNPFNPVTRINYELDRKTQVNITVYNLLGCAVKQLFNEQQAAGSYQISWNGTDENNLILPSGTYIIRLHTDNFNQVQKVLFLK